MHTAACNNNIAFVKRCWTERLLTPQLVNATDLAGNTPLHVAVVKGHEHMVRRNMTDVKDMLHGRATQVEVLLGCGALVNVQNRDNGLYSNGWMADGSSPPTLVRSLSVSNGEAARSTAPSLQSSSLPMMSSGPLFASLPVPANGSAVSSNHNTPVHLAAELGRASILEELLQHGPNLSIRNAAGKSPLQCALEAEVGHAVLVV